MSDSEQTPRGGPFSRPGAVIALAIVGVIVVCVVIFAVSAATRQTSRPGSTAAPTDAPSTGSGGETAADKSVCGLPGFEASGTLKVAPPTKWQLVGTVAAPTARQTTGPGRIDSDGFRSCYSHTPEGAVFAVANYLALASDARYFKKIASELDVPGAGQQAAETQAETASPSSVRVQVSGFAIDSYSRSRATVDLAVTNEANGQLTSFPVEIEWSGGDWKLVLTNDGMLPLSSSALSSLGGYIPWAGA